MKTLSRSGDSEETIAPGSSDELIVQALAKLDTTAMGIAVGTLFGMIIFIATIILVIKGGEHIGPNLGLLSQYFIGYEVTPIGSLIGLGYGLVSGFILGWLIAFLRNLMITIYIHVAKLKAGVASLNDFMD